MNLEEAHKVSYENGDQAGNDRKKFLPIVSRTIYYSTGILLVIWWLYVHAEDIWQNIKLDLSVPSPLMYGYIGLGAAGILLVIGMAVSTVSEFKKKKGGPGNG